MQNLMSDPADPSFPLVLHSKDTQYDINCIYLDHLEILSTSRCRRSRDARGTDQADCNVALQTLMHCQIFLAMLTVEIRASTLLAGDIVAETGSSRGRLEGDLGPSGSLLEAVSDFVRRFTHGDVFLHIPAVEALLFQLHAQSKVLRQGVCGGPAHL